MSRKRLEELLEVSGPDAVLGTLIMGEVLTRRGQIGPLARLWASVGKRPVESSEEPNEETASSAAPSR